MSFRHGLSLLSSIGIVTLTAQAHAQEPKFEYGKAEEVKEVKSVEWKADAQAGAILTTGNSHTTTMAAGFNASRKAGDNKLGIEIGAAYGKADLKVINDDRNEDGVITADEFYTVESTAPNNYLGKIRYDRFLTEKNSLYASARVGADKAAGKSFIAGGQLGYSRLLIKTGSHEIAGEFGYDFSYESYESADADSVQIHSGRVFLGYAGALSADTGLTGQVELLTNVNEEKDAIENETGGKGVDAFADNRVVAKLGLNTKLTTSVSFRFGFTAKYDSAPAPIAPGTPGFASGFTPLSEELDTITDVGLIVNLL